MESTAAIADNPRWSEALAAVGLGDGAPAPAPDLTLFFASPAYEDLETLVAQAYRRSAASVLIGCSGQGIIGPNREVEGQEALSVLHVQLPGAELHPRHITPDELARLRGPEDWLRWAGVPVESLNAWIVLADPFTFDVEALIDGLTSAYPRATIAGGLASGLASEHGTHLFLNGAHYGDGAVILGIGGAYTVRSVVAQGAAPIGEPWTITSVDRNIVRKIGNRPALEVLRETLNALSEEERGRAARNLLVGLAMNEYRERFEQGDFLIRNLLGVDPESGAMAIGAMPEVGQTIQFQIRDAKAADFDLKRQLLQTRQAVDPDLIAGALLCTCNGRGVGLFGSPDHDARAVAAEFGPVPIAGFFCNGEIGPVGGRTYLHGFTASLALFVPRDATPSPRRFVPRDPRPTRGGSRP
ncbi:MAG TPA: FIST N-terminal domain-containing protein [Chloroflexota bacterium]|nr:FIST N-terminal domain-containing protein [Chloroflexota bacterium]